MSRVVGSADGAVVLLPIKPRYATQIMDGSKRVVVYASAPVQRVLGCFRVGRVETDTPASLWERYSDVGGIGSADFWAYFGDRDRGTALCVDTVLTLRRPLSLADLDGSLRASQSYKYLDPEVMTALQSGAE
jgi:predicted transcriptional regulator